MKRLSMSLMVASLVIVMALGSFVIAQEVSSQNVVGFVKVPIITGWNLVSIPMQKVASYSGTIDSANATSISVAGSPWSAGQFAWEVAGQESLGSKSYFYVEITDTTSAYEGRHFYVTNSGTASLTIKDGMPSDIIDPASELPGKTFKIVAANRIIDIFGDPSAEANVPLVPMTDQIYLHNGASWEVPIFYSGNVPPFASQKFKWKQNTTEVPDLPIDRDEGIFIYHTGSGTNLTVSGEVAANNRAVVVSAGWNLIGGDVVMSDLVSSTSMSNHFKANLDVIYPHTAGASWDVPVIWTGHDSPFASQWDKWKQNTDDVTASLDMDMAKGYFLNVSSNFVVTRTSPLR